MKNLPLKQRIAQIDWPRVTTDLDNNSWALLQNLLPRQECDQLAALYPHEKYFRSRVVMSRHNFGRGEYQYFAYPLPATVAGLRNHLYPRLAPIANHWNQCMNIEQRYP